jgi:hypothetical protein
MSYNLLIFVPRRGPYIEAILQIKTMTSLLRHLMVTRKFARDAFRYKHGSARPRALQH